MKKEQETPSEITFQTKAAYLEEILGSKLTAYIGGVKETRIIRNWVLGNLLPSEAETKRLNAAYDWTQYLDRNEIPNSEIQLLAMGTMTWYGENEESNPARLFRNIDTAETPEKEIKRVMANAKHYVAFQY